LGVSSNKLINNMLLNTVSGVIRLGNMTVAPLTQIFLPIV